MFWRGPWMENVWYFDQSVPWGRKIMSLVDVHAWVGWLCGVYRPTREFFTHMDTIAGKGLHFFTYARHSWPLSSEGSLTCHTYCDTGLPFIMVISEDPWHSHLLPSVWQWSCHTCFYDSGVSRPGVEPWSPACEANALPLRHRGGQSLGKKYYELGWFSCILKKRARSVLRPQEKWA